MSGQRDTISYLEEARECGKRGEHPLTFPRSLTLTRERAKRGEHSLAGSLDVAEEYEVADEDCQGPYGEGEPEEVPDDAELREPRGACSEETYLLSDTNLAGPKLLERPLQNNFQKVSEVVKKQKKKTHGRSRSAPGSAPRLRCCPCCSNLIFCFPAKFKLKSKSKN